MHKIIFEGAELAGKSWLMGQVYDYLEPKYNQEGILLNGCHWFNCDVGVYGTKHGKPVIDNYINIFKELKGKNLLIEKFFMSDIVYNRLHRKIELDYFEEEQQLIELDFKIIMITFPEDEELLKKRIADRLRIYPHYERILHNPKWYINQQREYLKELEKTSIPNLIIETNKLPDPNLVSNILKWIGER